MGNSTSFSVKYQPVPKCPFQVGVNLSPNCDGSRCGFGLWCRVHGRCLVKCLAGFCRVHGDGGL